MSFVCYRKSSLEIVGFSGIVPVGYTGEQEIIKNVLPNFGGNVDDYGYIEINQAQETARVGKLCSIQLDDEEKPALIIGEKPIANISPLKTELSADKYEIMSDGIDTSTISISIQPPEANVDYVDVLVDGPPVTEVDVVNGQATFEFSATDPGKYMVEVVCQNLRNYIFIKVV